MYCKIYKDKKGELRWTIYAGNGRKIANSGEGYKRMRDLKNALRRLTLSIYENSLRVKVE